MAVLRAFAQVVETTNHVNPLAYIVPVVVALIAGAASVIGIYAKSRADHAAETAIGADKTATEAKHHGDLVESEVKHALEQRREHGDALSQMRKTVDNLAGQVLDMHTATSRQLAVTSDALVECEKHRAKDGEAILELTAKVEVLTTEVATLRDAVNG